MPPIPPGYCQFNFVWTMTGDQEEMINTLAFSITDPGAASVSAICNTLFDLWGNVWSTELATSLWLERVEGRMGATAGSVVGQSTLAREQMGTSTANVPPNSALLVKKVTAMGGRENRGRMYVPGCNEPSVDNVGNLDSGFRTSVNGKLNTFLSGANAVANVGEAVVLHSDALIPPTPIVSLQLDPRLATMRRRLRR